jgi:hypothetical protein
MAKPPKLTQEIRDKAAKEAREEVLRTAKRKGVTLCRTMQRLKEALDAKETKFFSFQGEVIQQEDVIAHGIRLKAVEIALAIHDAMPASKHAVVDKDGIPQDLSGGFTNLEAATRLMNLMSEAMKRKSGAKRGSPKDH